MEKRGVELDIPVTEKEEKEDTQDFYDPEDLI